MPNFVPGQQVTGTETTGTGTFNTSAFPSNNAAGNAIIVGVTDDSGVIAGGTTSITDTQGNVYVKILAFANNSSTGGWIAKNIKGGSNTLTINYSTGNTTNVGAVAQEFYDVDTITAIDRSVGALGTTTNAPNSGPSAPLLLPGELVIGIAGWLSAAVTASLGAGFSNLVQASVTNGSVAMESMTASSQNPQTATFTLSGTDNWECIVATIRGLPHGTTTSQSSTSISSTSSSISSTSSSISSTSGSTSISSTSDSTSSTSSSISSTSSSTSSTSISSTSSSTSISSTSSSISSTSTSSTSMSSTSQSTSLSSTSSSISSTSSSISSTSHSTSSTSFSSTSSSSSTSTTTFPPPYIDFDDQDSLVLSPTAADLQSDLNAYQVSNLMGDDGDYFIQRGSEYTALHFQRTGTNNTSNINIIWKGRSTESSIVSPIFLQIFNQNSAQWENLDYDNTKPPDTDYILNGSITSNVSNYYDPNFQVTCRIYQQVI